MAVVLNDPGIDRGGQAGSANIAQNLLALGQQAQQTRMATGQQFFEQFKAEAESKGLSMSQLLADPAYQQSVFGNLMGITGGDRNAATQMFDRLKAGEATPTQVMNKKLYDIMAQHGDLDLLDKQVEEQVSRTVKEISKGDPTAVTPELIAGLKDKFSENNLWSPIAEALGAKPESVTEDGIPVWGQDFKDIRDNIAKHYMGKTWEEIKVDPTLKNQLIQSMKTGGPISEALVDSKLSKEAQDFASNWAVEPINAVKDPEAEAAIADRRGGLTGIAALKELQNPDRPEESGDQAQIFVEPGAAKLERGEPISFGTYTPEEIKEVIKTETVMKTIPGYASTFEAVTDRLREQAPTESQRTVAGDLPIRAAEQDIEYKQALTLQALASLQGRAAEDPRFKSMIDQNMKTYDFFINESPQEMTERLKSSEDVTNHNQQIMSFINNMKDLGIYVETIKLPKNRWLRPDQEILTVGGMRRMGGASGDATSKTKDDMLNQFN